MKKIKNKNIHINKNQKRKEKKVNKKGTAQIIDEEKH